jgi:hypothetical protein
MLIFCIVLAYYQIITIKFQKKLQKKSISDQGKNSSSCDINETG